MRRTILAVALLSIACASTTPKGAEFARAQVINDPAPAKPPAIDIPPPIGQLKATPPKPGTKRAHAPPQQVVSEANKHAAQAPESGGTFNAIVQYTYEPGTLYQIYAAPMRITDVALEPGEHIVGQPACGDTVRWVLAEGKSLDGGLEQWHIYLKPTRPGLETNLAVNTDRHAYMLELHSYEETYMAAVAWRFPQDEIAKLQAQVDTQNDSTPVVGLNSLHFDYAVKVIKGKPAWVPTQVFDDGRRTFVRFPQAMLVREAPALFVLRDKETELVNYRVKNDLYVIDRLIDAAELRVGGKGSEEIVRVRRNGTKG